MLGYGNDANGLEVVQKKTLRNQGQNKTLRSVASCRLGQPMLASDLVCCSSFFVGSLDALETVALQLYYGNPVQRQVTRAAVLRDYGNDI